MALSTRKHKAVLILVFGFRLFVFIHFANEPYFLRTSRNDDTYQQRKNAEFDKILTPCMTWKRCVFIHKSRQETFSNTERVRFIHFHHQFPCSHTNKRSHNVEFLEEKWKLLKLFINQVISRLVE
ncbi:hypothetical protein T4E_5447 [Trichinella pseudospiralis]|uniref:Uncharacterized protein n=2 Tax=Trichinella pseudospiralis TaxID=6337 RepID=A0A0V0XLG1_TRIPS|nr:hypothetical protein T4E_5447 [Trichinella pseudospiralis]KRY81917.1 hypothetical protein T4D_3419 [Trichinella pseudospiralis]